MTESAKLEDAVTGQLLFNNSNGLPPGGKLAKLRRIGNRVAWRPNEVRLHAGPDWDGKGFKPGHGPESGIPVLLNGEKLKRKVPEGACADVHTETVAEWSATCLIEGSAAPARSVVLVSANPDMNICGQLTSFSKGEAIPSREKGAASITFVRMVKNNRFRKHKTRDRAGF
jgi:hypothetical protein